MNIAEDNSDRVSVEKASITSLLGGTDEDKPVYESLSKLQEQTEILIDTSSRRLSRDHLQEQGIEEKKFELASIHQGNHLNADCEKR